jgi:hypothetical protein
VKGRPPRFTVEEKKTLLDVTIQLAAWCFPQSISEVIEKVISDVIVSTRARKTQPDKRKGIVGNAGQCLTHQEAVDIMEEQEQIKRKKYFYRFYLLVCYFFYLVCYFLLIPNLQAQYHHFSVISFVFVFEC